MNAVKGVRDRGSSCSFHTELHHTRVPTTAITCHIFILQVPLDFPSDIMGKFWIMIKCTFVLVCMLLSKQNLNEKYFDPKKKALSVTSKLKPSLIRMD